MIYDKRIRLVSVAYHEIGFQMWIIFKIIFNILQIPDEDFFNAEMYLKRPSNALLPGRWVSYA